MILTVLTIIPYNDGIKKYNMTICDIKCENDVSSTQ